MNRRDLLFASMISGVVGLIAPTTARADAACKLDLTTLNIETDESPFFEHYHSLVIPVSTILMPPEKVVIQTSPIDLESYDNKAFESFIESSHLEREKLLHHSHPVTLTRDQLNRIARGDKAVEVRVISAGGNYVHNLKITAYQSILAKRKRSKS